MWLCVGVRDELRDWVTDALRLSESEADDDGLAEEDGELVVVSGCV